VKIDLKEAVRNVFNRFPYTFFLVVCEFVGLSLIIELDYFQNHEREAYILGMVLLSLLTVLMMSIAIQLFCEKKDLNRGSKLSLYFFSTLVLLGLSYLFIYKDIQSFDVLDGTFTSGIYRLLILNLVSFLSIFVLPFWDDEDNKDWWNFFISSISRAAISILYAAVVFFGLTIALFALERFWDIKIFDNQYDLVGVFSYILVAPIHFLRDVWRFENKEFLGLPKFLLTLVKFVLTPLISIYIVILYPYIFSFPFKDEWPANEATFIILVLFSMIGAGLVLFYGLEKKARDFKFAYFFTKIFSAIAIPTILFWIYSLYLRIDAYGVSVNRFILMSIIVWFLAIAIYYLLSKETKARIVVFSFILLLSIVVYFPYSSFYWGEKIQADRLVETFKDNGLFVNNKFVKGETGSSSLDQSIYDSFVYLNRYHTLDSVKSYLSEDLAKELKLDSNGYSEKLSIYEKIDFFDEIDYEKVLSEYIQVRLAENAVEIHSGYSGVEYIDLYMDDVKGEFVLKGESFKLSFDLSSESISQDNCAKVLENDKEIYGTDILCVSDVLLMTKELEQGKFVISLIEGKVKDEKFEEYYHIAGYLFTK